MVVQQMEKTEGGQLEEKTEGKKERGVELRDRAVGDRVKERPTVFLECSVGFVGGGEGAAEEEGVVCDGPLEGYESVCTCVCVHALKKCVFTLKDLRRR